MRLIEGRSGWWCVAPSGIALLPPGWVEDGRLADERLAALTATGITARRPVESYALTVLTDTGCNLGCRYCFQNTGPAAPGRFDPPRLASATLTPATAAAITTFALDRMRQAGLSKLYLLLFGGEPLLNPIGCVDLLRRCAAAADTTAAMVSNGTLLRPRIARQLHELGLRRVQVTLDGPRRIHDRTRVSRGGRGTFDSILDNVAAAQQATDLRFTVRINLTAAVLPEVAGLLDHLTTRISAPDTLLELAPILDAGAGLTLAAGGGRADAAAELVIAAYRRATALGFRTPRPTDGRCAFCTERDGLAGAVVNADGVLYSCWESAGRPGYQVGTVATGYRDYPPETWVSCAASAGGRRFTDLVDAGLLDLIADARRDRECTRS